MKYAIRFFNGCRTLPVADEIIIRYNKKSPYLIEYATKAIAEGQRLIVDISALDDIGNNLKILTAAGKAHPNYALMTTKEDEFITEYAEAQIPFFFIEGAGSLDEVTAQINSGVSDIYILNELGFSIDKVSKICHDAGVQVRVYPNVAQSSTKLYVDSFKKFYIRPEDISEYEDYVDVFEFFGPLDKQPVLFDIYSDSRWLGNLNELIIGLEDDILNSTIVPPFGEIRTKCEKRCVFGRCNICDNIKGVSNALNEKELGIRYERKINAEYMQNVPAETPEANAEVSEG